MLVPILAAFTARGESPAPAARLVSAEGAVTVGGREIAPGDAIPAGESIKTGESGARVMTGDGSVVDLGPASSAKVAPTSESEPVPTVDLEFGSVRALIKKKTTDSRPKFRIRTKTSVLSVRGTEFLVVSKPAGNASRDTVTVASGQVEAMLGNNVQPTLLAPGTQWTATPTAAGPPKIQTIQLAAPDLSRVVQTARVADTTFRQAVTVDPGKQGRGGDTLLRAAQVASNSVHQRPPQNLLTPVVRQAPLSQLNQIDGGYPQKKIVGGIHIIFKP